ncbi:hypothetical protein SAMN05421741_11821 [Paenimyroides ummariense]|uniref:Uncharacterized protein n=1 Tax=Paenimyroides ummariense TaxID=913024 RepID=A0A1I5DZR6_9FLAO|nr:hypothetical protein [Paenimyroides ummariense]SFO04702.1 hypothetical protein SAMN05421741_11821 [Paenimyroides ummariense]
MALGEIGISYNDFYALTPRSFTNIINGFRNKQYTESKERWEQIRYLFYASLKPHLKGNPTLRSLMPLPWDNETDDPEANETKIETPEQAAAIIKRQEEFWAAIDIKRQLKKSKSKTDFDGISTD